MPTVGNRSETAIFAAGCFWGVEEAFRTIKGVEKTEVGYAGGHVVRPSYKRVCTGRTGHAQAVKISFDPEKITYEELLAVFWIIHDPTTLNRQGADMGSQYRSAIFYNSPEQEVFARKFKERLEQSGIFKDKLVTEIVPATEFYQAEEYHQKYLMKRNQKTCEPEWSPQSSEVL